MSRTQWNLLVDCLILLAFLTMLGSGWIMQFDLPHGSPSRGWAVLGWDRHQWGDLHSWASWAFIGLVAVHFILHWEWILCMSKGGAQAPVERRRLGLLALAVALFLAALAATAPFILQPSQDAARDNGHGRGRGPGER